MKEFNVTYLVNNNHGNHVINTSFELKEIKKFGLNKVIQFHSKRLNIGDKYNCHVYGLREEDSYTIPSKNTIGNLIGKESFNKVYSRILSVYR